MPIRVKCNCQQQFDAPDHLAGKTVKCPKCASPLTIPRPFAAAARQAAPVPSVSMASLLDEAGVKQTSVHSGGCPSCGAPFSPEAVLCVECGFNFRTGRKLATKSIAGEVLDGVTDGHGVNSEFLIQRARDQMEADRQMQKEMVSFGIPWWGYLLLLIGTISFITGMSMLPQNRAMYLAGWIMIVVGSIIVAAGAVWMRINAFKVSPTWGIIVSLPTLIGDLIFAFTNWDEGAGPFFVMFSGGLVIGLAFLAFWLSTVLGQPADEYSMILQYCSAYLV